MITTSDPQGVCDMIIERTKMDNDLNDIYFQDFSSLLLHFPPSVPSAGGL